MIKVYICDDEQLWIDKAKDIIIGMKAYDNSNFEIHTYRDAKSLIDVMTVRKEYADIVILDIDMPSINGFETAAKIKGACPDVLLLFYTVHEQYVFDSFQFQPFRYIRKENAKRELTLAVDAAIKLIDKQEIKTIVLKTNDDTYKININSIMYFELLNRKCNVYLSDSRVIIVRKSIKDLFNMINDPNFILLHNGAAVNLKYVKKYSSYDVTMNNDTHLIVSRSHIKNVRTAIMNYWGDRI